MKTKKKKEKHQPHILDLMNLSFMCVYTSVFVSYMHTQRYIHKQATYVPQKKIWHFQP